MKIAYGSDFHFEFYTKKEAKFIIKKWKFEHNTQLIIIAGDLHVGAHNVIEMLEYIYEIHNIPIVYVSGNHEYYHSSFEKENKIFNHQLCKGISYILLHDTMCIDGINIYGCMGNIDGSYENIDIIQHGVLNDFYLIKDFENHYIYGRRERKALNALGKNHRIDIIVTHTMPSPRCISEKYKGDVLNACFTNDWTEEILKYKPKFYICGHTHDYVNVDIHKTQVLANPFGYPHENKGWKWKYIEINKGD